MLSMVYEIENDSKLVVEADDEKVTVYIEHDPFECEDEKKRTDAFYSQISAKLYTAFSRTHRTEDYFDEEDKYEFVIFANSERDAEKIARKVIQISFEAIDDVREAIDAYRGDDVE